MAILVIAEHDNDALNPNTFNTLFAASQISANTGAVLHLLVAGDNAESVIEQAQAIPVLTKVLSSNHEALAHGLAENIAWLVKKLSVDYTHILSPSSNFGKNFMPRVAAMLDSMQVSDIIEVISSDTFIRPIYAGNAHITVQSNDQIKIITIRNTAFDAVETTGGNANVEEVIFDGVYDRVEFISRDDTLSERPDLMTARVIVSGGRGIANKENFFLIEDLASKLNAAIGASRAAVDSGYASNDLQVGQTGKVVAPELYVAVGISGAIQHQAGMRDSKVIVAINRDYDAPIFKIADYGIVGDLFEILPELIEAL